MIKLLQELVQQKYKHNDLVSGSQGTSGLLSNIPPLNSY